MKHGLVLAGVAMLATTMRAEVRPPTVAGTFYPGSREALEREVKGYLRGGPATERPLALIAPHAGYVFSGATAGRVFAGLTGAKLTRVILLGPSHHASFTGGALPGKGVTAFATPLGELPVDTAAVAKLRDARGFGGPPDAHNPEHCLEVQLPFLQVAVGQVPIVPILVGHATDMEAAVEMARGIAPLLDDGTLVVVSSDFTHHGAPYGYAPFARDRDLDKALLALGHDTADRAAAIDLRGFWYQVEVSSDTVCGARPIAVLLALLQHAFSGSGKVIDVTTSGEVSGNWSQVVTYAAVGFSGQWRPWRDDAPPDGLGTVSDDEKKALLAVARATLESYLVHDGSLARSFAGHPVAGNLGRYAGVFVTLNNLGEKAKRQGRLRGCIGVMEAREPLVDAVVHAAVSAANDPRFPQLERGELSTIGVEISVLSPMRQIPDYKSIELGTHGVVISKAGRRAVFLPQVATETGWDLPTFLSHLSTKAGLPSDAWRSGTTFEVFTAQVFGERE